MSIKFLADENIPRICVSSLRAQGLDISWISEIASSISDIEVCSLARMEGRIVITSDKDFGDLVIRDGIIVPGVILLRLSGLGPGAMADLLVEALMQPHVLSGQFAVITKDTIRIRQLPDTH
jgi:predicted nuclease of predicted toxin-antitoxin system